MRIVSATVTDASCCRAASSASWYRAASTARRRRAAWFAGVALVLFASGVAAAEPSQALLGQPAPDFTERSMSGGNLRLSEHRGEVVLVGFWTSWCSTCRAYLEHLGRLHATYGSAGLVVVGVSLDDDARRASSLLQAVGAQFPNVFDARKQLGPAWRVADVPTTVLIDRAGVVRHVHGELQRRDEPQLIEEIRRLLDE
jgi:peroxiredoxin